MAAVAQQHAVTDALGAVRDGAPGALDRLVALVYADLARIANRQLGLEAPGHTLSTTALVHEAYLRLVDQTRAQWVDRVQFFAVAAHVMRRVLVDYARRHRAARRGGAQRGAVSPEARESIGTASLAVAERADVLLARDEGVDRLSALDARQARVVQWRFFWGLTEA